MSKKRKILTLNCVVNACDKNTHNFFQIEGKQCNYEIKCFVPKGQSIF